MHALALALGGPRDAFEGERAGDPFWILRVIGYPPAQALEDFEIIGWYVLWAVSVRSLLFLSVSVVTPAGSYSLRV